MSLLTRHSKTQKIIYTHVFLSTSDNGNKALFYTDLNKSAPEVDFPGYYFKYTQYAPKTDAKMFEIYQRPFETRVDYDIARAD